MITNLKKYCIIHWSNSDIVFPNSHVEVYSEHLLDPLLQTIFALAGPRTTILVIYYDLHACILCVFFYLERITIDVQSHFFQLGYEIRSTMVHDQMIDMWKSNFNLKSIPRSKVLIFCDFLLSIFSVFVKDLKSILISCFTQMDVKYQHPSIQLFAMDLKSRLRSEKSGNLNNCEGNSCSSEESVSDMKDDKNGIDEDSEHTGIKECDDDLKVTLAIKNGKLDGWESRRHGSFAARLLKDVKIT